MCAKCKICNLDDELRLRIEDDMLYGDLGPVKITKKYPEARLNPNNVYSHREHLQSMVAKRTYEKALRGKATVFLSPQITPSSSQLSRIGEDGEGVVVIAKGATEGELTPVASRDITTGNAVLDDILILDMIIEQGRNRLADVTVKDVLDAIKLKQHLLGNSSSRGPDGEAGQNNTININQVLQLVSKNEEKVVGVQ